jgi:hypothetical protein
MLDKLYVKGIPVRGDIRIAASQNGDPIMVASYITGARVHGHGEPDVIIDPKISNGVGGSMVLICQRKDTGKMVRGVFHKSKLVPPEIAKKIQNLVHKKIPAGLASIDEKKFVRETVQSFVKKALLNMPEGVLDIEVEQTYLFPSP